jgi:hypothetical protein
MRICEAFDKCKFIEKNEKSRDPVIKGLIKYYCKSSMTKDCARKNIAPDKTTGDLSPTGECCKQ